MIPVSEHIKDLLVKHGFGKFAMNKGWGIFILDEPDTPNTCITIYDVPGLVERTMDSSRHFFKSDFQVRVRAMSYLEAHGKIEDIRKQLDRYTTTKGSAKQNLVMDKIRYDNILMESEPLPLGKDSTGRFIFTINGTAYRQEIPSQEKE